MESVFLVHREIIMRGDGGRQAIEIVDGFLSRAELGVKTAS